MWENILAPAKETGEQRELALRRPRCRTIRLIPRLRRPRSPARAGRGARSSSRAAASRSPSSSRSLASTAAIAVSSSPSKDIDAFCTHSRRAAIREIPLAPQLAAVLSTHRAAQPKKSAEAWVFPSQAGTPFGHRNAQRRVLKRAATHAGLEDGGWPPLRFHEYADVFVMPMLLRRGCSGRFLGSGCGHNQSASRNARSVSVGR